MRSKLAALPLLLVSLVMLGHGCARDGALELELTIPARPAGSPELYAVAMFMTGDFEFDSVAIEPQYSGTPLTDSAQQVHFSVLSDHADGRVRLVVYFCETTRCRGDDPSTLPQAWFEFERATYVGRVTRWAGVIAEVPSGRPATPECVDRCQIEGCIGGEGYFCRMGGTHYCQQPEDDPGVEVCDP